MKLVKAFIITYEPRRSFKYWRTRAIGISPCRT